MLSSTGTYDVLVGINLLREGLDIPEVSLICILDADKEGFLRSARSLIQTTGRAARNSNGKVIFYADKITDSMQKCIDETARRRSIQEEYNKIHNIKPTTIKKEIREVITNIAGGSKKTKSKDIPKLNANIERALYIFNQEKMDFNIDFNQIIPSDEPYVYKFSISNFNNGFSVVVKERKLQCYLQ